NVTHMPGNANRKEYKVAVRTITYPTTSDNPDTNSRNISIVANDGIADSNAAIATINVTPVNDAPVLDLDASTAGTGYTAFVISNSGGAGAKSIADTDITITDLDNTHITGATITLVGPQDSGHSLTVAGLPAGITASAYNPATGVLTLSGSATLADYQAAIQAIKFMSTDATQT